MSFTKLIRAWSKNYPGFLWVIHIWRWISFYPNFWLIVVSFLSHSTSPNLILWFIKRGQHRTLLEILWVPAAWRYTKDKFSPNAYLWRGQIFCLFFENKYILHLQWKFRSPHISPDCELPHGRARFKSLHQPINFKSFSLNFTQ